MNCWNVWWDLLQRSFSRRLDIEQKSENAKDRLKAEKLLDQLRESVFAAGASTSS